MKKDAGWYYSQYLASANQKNYDAAKYNFNKAIELQPHNTSYRLERGGLLYNQTDFAAAQADYEIVIQFSKDEDELVEAYSQLVFIGERLSDDNLSIRAMNWIIDNNYGSEHQYHRRGDSFLGGGEYSKAISDYSKALEIRPDHFVILLKRGQAHFKSGDYSSAIEDITHVISFNDIPDIAKEMAYHWRGLAYYRLGNYNKALQDANAVLRIRDSDTISDSSSYYSQIET